MHLRLVLNDPLAHVFYQQQNVVVFVLKVIVVGRRTCHLIKWWTLMHIGWNIESNGTWRCRLHSNFTKKNINLTLFHHLLSNYSLIRTFTSWRKYIFELRDPEVIYFLSRLIEYRLYSQWMCVRVHYPMSTQTVLCWIAQDFPSASAWIAFSDSMKNNYWK